MGKTDIQETEKGVWRLVELAEGEGLKILPTNGERNCSGQENAASLLLITAVVAEASFQVFHTSLSR